MSEMIERVAQAIQDKLDREFAKRGWLSAEEMANLAARIAIEAMREPADLMGNGLPQGYRPGSHSAREIWQHMIDAALEKRGC